MRFAALALLLALASAALGQAPRPNVVIVMADDLGFSDLGSYGGEIRTPHLDALAENGVRFTQFYSTPRCCPTRASLLTGVYPHQAGVGAMNQDLGVPAYQGFLNDRVATLAELLKAAGYRTGMVGKWHLSNMTVSPQNPDSKAILNREQAAPIGSEQQKKTWPNARGFDAFVGTIPGVGDFFDPYGLVRDGEPVAEVPADFYYTDFIGAEAADYVRRSAGDSRPFFLYVAHVAPHWPLHAREEDVAKYRDVYKVGWDALRAERNRKLRASGIIDARWPMSPRHQIDPNRPAPIAWDEVRNKAWEVERMATYAAQVSRLDRSIGELVAALRETGQLDNTVFVFLSDNGACAEDVQEAWYDIPTRTREGERVRVGNDARVTPGPQASFQSYGPRWANVSNTPLRLFKHHTNEGGISTPFIVHWPAGVAARGTLVRDVSQLIDVVPTCLELAGAAYPAGLTPLEGRSFARALKGEALGERAAPLFWEHEGHRGVRAGKWKMVAADRGAWELYDVEADRTELRELSGEHPEVVAQLSVAYDAWAKRVGVEPWPVRAR